MNLFVNRPIKYLAVVLFDFLLSLGLSGFSEVSLLDDGEVVVSLEEGDFRGLGTNDKDVLESGGELKTILVLDVDDFVGSGVRLNSENGADSADVISTGDHDLSAELEFERGGDFVGSEVELDGVADLDDGGGEPEGSAVVGHNIGDSLGAHSSALDSAELELSFAGGDLGETESTLAVVEESVVGLGLEEGDDVHEADGEFVILSDFAVNGDVAVLGKDDHLGFSAGEGNFQFVSQ
jgi:hypothetical protein